MENTEKGAGTEVSVTISDDVIIGIAMNAAKEIDGVASIPSKITSGDLKEIFTKKLSGKGVKVNIEDKNVSMDMYITVKYGVNIPKVAEEVQSSVKAAVENMTGLNVTVINVNVAGIAVGKEKNN